jgi:hypothetical protein
MATCNRLIIEIPGDVSYSWGERPACCPGKVGPGAAFRQQEHPYTMKGNPARAAGTARLYLPRMRRVRGALGALLSAARCDPIPCET